MIFSNETTLKFRSKGSVCIQYPDDGDALFFYFIYIFVFSA